MRGLVIAVVFLVVTPLHAQSVGSDRAAALYSSQIHFDANNEPVVSIGVVDGERRVSFSSQARMRILVDGPGGPEIITEPGRRWTASVSNPSSAQTAWHVRLSAHASDRMADIQQARKLWKSRSVEIKSVDVGSVFGFVGKMLSSQNIILVTKKAYSSVEEARTAAATLSKRYGFEAKVLPRIRERASGDVTLTDGLISIRAKDVLWMEPVNPEGTITVEKVQYGRGFPWRGRQDRQYRGTLYITVGRDGGIVVGNMISAETALKGLVPAEMIPSAPSQALQAQAIAARTELLAKVGRRHLADPYLFCGDVHCQVYAGSLREDARTSAAVDATKGRVLVHDDRLVDSVYSANCGGHTEHSHEVWKGGPITTLHGKPEGETLIDLTQERNVEQSLHHPAPTYCNMHPTARKSFRWDKTVAVQDVQDWLDKNGLGMAEISGVHVMKRGVSGRATEIEIVGKPSAIRVRGELRIRQMFGSLKSSFFSVQNVLSPTGQHTHFHFRGGGFGHGVGMCQDGAMGRAKSGHSHRDILQHYYNETTVDQAY